MEASHKGGAQPHRHSLASSVSRTPPGIRGIDSTTRSMSSLFAWIVSLNRRPSPQVSRYYVPILARNPPAYVLDHNHGQEYEMCFRCLDPESQAKVARLTKAKLHDEAWGECTECFKTRSVKWLTLRCPACLCGRILPHIIMQQRSIPRDAWEIRGSESGSKPSVVSRFPTHHDGSRRHLRSPLV